MVEQQVFLGSEKFVLYMCLRYIARSRELLIS